MRLHPMQVSRPPRTGAGLLPGGVGAGVPELTAGKLKEYRGCNAREVGVAGVEGGVVAMFAIFAGISLLCNWSLDELHSEGKPVANRTAF